MIVISNCLVLFWSLRQKRRNRASVSVPNPLWTCPSRTERASPHSTTASTCAASFDDLVGATEDRSRDLDADLSRHLEI